MFKLISNFTPQGDQPQAIIKLADGLKNNLKDQVLLGVTGSGKTFTMASVIEKAQLPTLIISPNKTLAAQLYQEFKSFFPQNAVQYFVSYYDYYQPEAYMPEADLYIQKDARINEEIDRLRHAALQGLMTRKDIIIIASVSCIYGIGNPAEYQKTSLEIKTGQKIGFSDLTRHLQFLQYEKISEKEPGSRSKPGKFFSSENSIININLVTGEKINVKWRKKQIAEIIVDNAVKNKFNVYPAKFWVTPQDKMRLALKNIKTELEERAEELQAAGKFEESERLERRVEFDMEMLRKKGYVNGIENYSRHLSFRRSGEPPYTLLDFFPKPFLLFIDESHIAIPQIRGMYNGDCQRKTVLVEYGFRLPSALDNRPLKFNEFLSKTGQTVYVSATPAQYEMEQIENNGRLVEQLVRPTGILDPKVIIKPAKTQIMHLLKEIKKRAAKNERVLALTLTKRSAEDLTEFLLAKNIRAEYLHSEIKTLKRPEVINALRKGEVDVIVGINLLREGLDLPEVSLVAILDADREGFLRNQRSLIQMAGRAARSINGQVILYADELTGSIKRMLTETSRRRKHQEKFNKKTGAVPVAIQKRIMEIIKAAEPAQTS
ncbi:MAG: excinuclease ABC subunit UvrB [Candidatus Brennerbacteria bacterium]|nr:excinuclease ABC subunit UvrB [Candidatus Brennerbacteria bacterium]